jgi:AraC family transcriptional regulator
MAVVGRGRIVVWEGASLWVLTREQKVAEIQPHAHHAIQITFQLEGWFEIGVMSERLSGPIAAVWSDTPHTFQASGAVAFLFVDPESPVGRKLGKAWFGDQPWAHIAGGKLTFLLDELHDSLRNAVTADEMLRLGRKIIDALPGAEEPLLPDPRVLAMISYARQNLENTITLTSTANQIRLSHSRARHLFAAQTGLPFKTYVLWLRLERAVALYARGSSLTEAAHTAGFADSAHFSRTFRRTFGLPAAALRLNDDWERSCRGKKLETHGRQST